MKTYVKKTRKMGRGVFAGQNFKAGDVVEKSHCLVWDDFSDQRIQDSDLKLYTFATSEVKSDPAALALGNGSLFNHSESPNVKYRYDRKSNMVIFTAVTRIKKNQQLFIDYGYDPVQCEAEWNRDKKWVQEYAQKEMNRLDEESKRLAQEAMDVELGVPSRPPEKCREPEASDFWTRHGLVYKSSLKVPDETGGYTINRELGFFSYHLVKWIHGDAKLIEMATSRKFVPKPYL